LERDLAGFDGKTSVNMDIYEGFFLALAHFVKELKKKLLDFFEMLRTMGRRKNDAGTENRSTKELKTLEQEYCHSILHFKRNFY